MRTQPNIAGADKVAALFGEWPEFHDSEVLRVCICRDSPSEIDIHCVKWVIQSGAHRATAEKEAIVRFIFGTVTKCDLGGEDVHVQNVLSSASVEESDSGLYRVGLTGIFGLSGFIEGTRLSVTLM